ncbi:hypothetical protein BKP35_17425 [Anaerobacillus arseniciselenatis]|uniref:Uncharacterized protein n=1 Tax=Anaerobacillus arseniciselenatis TaxID=85682 RepID=A0A1S2L910_9BACI|nr:hypothetical protein [Anaerobacillus arseniciselenatis]OIJ08804.1 hypothetical protein BKP35_17425 [Anaerobacillus arseniciselenatis]
MRRIYIKVALVGVFVILLTLWGSGWLNLWKNGISVIANDVDRYHLQTYPIDGEYTVTIDLSDLRSNVGKVLYDDGNNQIYVETVYVRNESDFEVGFRTSGTYRLSGATLVSGIEHARTDNGFTSFERANAIATYRSESFKIYRSGSSGLNYRDGASFGYYLIPHDKEVVVDLDKDATMELNISNLYMHEWKKK